MGEWWDGRELMCAWVGGRMGGCVGRRVERLIVRPDQSEALLVYFVHLRACLVTQPKKGYINCGKVGRGSVSGLAL